MAHENNENYPEFTPPPALDEMLEGGRGEALVKWKRKPSGAVCITSMEGVPLSGSNEGEESEASSEAPMSRSYDQLDSMSDQM